MVKKQLIGECLYVINKRIKKLEMQIQLKININELSMKYSQVEICKIYKQFNDKITALYDLKQKSITKAMDDFNIKAIGFHVDTKGKKIDLVRIGTFTFHRPVCTSNNFLGVMDRLEVNDIYELHKEKNEYNIKTKKYIEPKKRKKIFIPAGDKTPEISFSKSLKILRQYINYKQKIKL